MIVKRITHHDCHIVGGARRFGWGKPRRASLFSYIGLMNNEPEKEEIDLGNINFLKKISSYATFQDWQMEEKNKLKKEETKRSVKFYIDNSKSHLHLHQKMKSLKKNEDSDSSVETLINLKGKLYSINF